MRFGLIQAAHRPPGVSLHRRYREILDEAVVAEEAGFDFYSVAEQHFDPGSAATTNVSASDVLLSAVAARTSRMRLMWLSAVLPIHHPLRIAESAATLDTISQGRFELATARSNDLPTMRAYEIDPATTRARWAESLEIISRALAGIDTEHRGEFWDIPSVCVNPAPVQQSLPLFYASTSAEGHDVAGRMGLGVVGGNSLTGGWPFVEECARTYKAAIADAAPLPGAAVNDQLYAFCFLAHCVEDVEQGKADAAPAVDSIISMVTAMFTRLASQAGDYAYMDDIRAMYDRRGDLDFLIERAPYISIGGPEFWIERIERLRSLGYDGVVLRVDGMAHDVCVRSIRMFGEHVMPHLRKPNEPT
jgi:alkanesulfonate monooxygenase SsuD/methylene tetrahydromethanopterin reductase-like flavin-dependent oxidoreductase (luciferase family)